MSAPFVLYGRRFDASVAVTRHGVTFKGKGADLRAVLDLVASLPDHTFQARPSGRKGEAQHLKDQED